MEPSDNRPTRKSWQAEPGLNDNASLRRAKLKSETIVYVAVIFAFVAITAILANWANERPDHTSQILMIMYPVVAMPIIALTSMLYRIRKINV